MNYKKLKCEKKEGMVHPQKTLSSFTHAHVVPNMYEFVSNVEHKGRYFEEPNSCWTPLTFLSPKKTIEVSYHYHLITSILQITFFCVQHKNETHTGLEQHEGE